MSSPVGILTTVSVERRLLLLSGNVQARVAFEEELTKFATEKGFVAANNLKGVDGLPNIARLYKSSKGIDMLVAEAGGVMAISLLTDQASLDLPQRLREDVDNAFERFGLRVGREP